MIDEIRDEYSRDLINQIAWDGQALKSPEFLPDDLTFRRMMTRTFSPTKPLTRAAVERLINEKYTASTVSQFMELLNRAIAGAVHLRNFASRVKVQKTLAPKSLDNGPISSSSLHKSDVWAARFLVFEQLFNDLDFQEYILERDNHKSLLWKFIQWGENLRVPEEPNPAESHSPLPQPSASGWEAMFRPIVRSLIYVVPITVGAGSVGSYIIDRQAEVRETTIQNSLPAITMTTPPTTIQNEPPSVTIQNLPPIPDNNDLAIQIANLARTSNDLSGLVGTLQNSSKNNQFLFVNAGDSGNQSPQPTIHLAFDDSPLTVHMGNEPLTTHPGSISPTSADSGGAVKPVSSSAPDSDANKKEPAKPAVTMPFKLNLDQVDLNVRTELYPTEMIAPTHPLIPMRPQLVVIGATLREQPVVLSGGQGKESSTSYFYLCDWRIPTRFLVSKTESSDPRSACFPSGKQSQQHGVYVFTKTAQYVSELDSYVSLDEASQRSFLLLGSRRIVLQVIPNLTQAPAAPNPPASPAQKGN